MLWEGVLAGAYEKKCYRVIKINNQKIYVNYVYISFYNFSGKEKHYKIEISTRKTRGKAINKLINNIKKEMEIYFPFRKGGLLFFNTEIIKKEKIKKGQYELTINCYWDGKNKTYGMYSEDRKYIKNGWKKELSKYVTEKASDNWQIDEIEQIMYEDLNNE